MTAGQTYHNGIDGLHSVGANWGETMTVIRRDTSALGCTRYIVADSHGGRRYALGKVSY